MTNTQHSDDRQQAYLQRRAKVAELESDIIDGALGLGDERTADLVLKLIRYTELKTGSSITAADHRNLIQPRLVDLIAGLRRHQVEEAVQILLDYIDTAAGLVGTRNCFRLQFSAPIPNCEAAAQPPKRTGRVQQLIDGIHFECSDNGRSLLDELVSQHLDYVWCACGDGYRKGSEEARQILAGMSCPNCEAAEQPPELPDPPRLPPGSDWTEVMQEYGRQCYEVGKGGQDINSTFRELYQRVGQVDGDGRFTWFDPIPEEGATLYARTQAGRAWSKRPEAVNLARTIADGDPPPERVTEKGVRMLAEAVMHMDALCSAPLSTEPSSKAICYMAGAILDPTGKKIDNRHPEWGRAVAQAEAAYRALVESEGSES